MAATIAMKVISRETQFDVKPGFRGYRQMVGQVLTLRATELMAQDNNLA